MNGRILGPSFIAMWDIRNKDYIPSEFLDDLSAVSRLAIIHGSIARAIRMR